MDSEEVQYRKCVYDIWATAKLSHAFHDELIDLMFENGFLIDTVVVCVTNADCITWKGRCYDADATDYKFSAEWTLNMEKFTSSVPHYYELTCLEIEPWEEALTGSRSQPEAVNKRPSGNTTSKKDTRKTSRR